MGGRAGLLITLMYDEENDFLAEKLFVLPLQKTVRAIFLHSCKNLNGMESTPCLHRVINEKS